MSLMTLYTHTHTHTHDIDQLPSHMLYLGGKIVPVLLCFLQPSLRWSLGVEMGTISEEEIDYNSWFQTSNLQFCKETERGRGTVSPDGIPSIVEWRAFDLKTKEFEWLNHSTYRNHPTYRLLNLSLCDGSWASETREWVEIPQSEDNWAWEASALFSDSIYYKREKWRDRERETRERIYECTPPEHWTCRW